MSVDGGMTWLEPFAVVSSLACEADTSLTQAIPSWDLARIEYDNLNLIFMIVLCQFVVVGLP